MIKFFCFATPQYKDIAIEGKENWNKFGLDVTIEEYPDQKSWAKNTLMRSTLLEAKRSEKSPIALIDADLRFVAKPELFETTKPWDIMCVKTGDQVWARYWSAGIVAFNVTATAQGCHILWASKCREDKAPYSIGLHEQLYLYETIEQRHPNVLALPVTYGWVPRTEKYIVPPGVVVVHVPASRKLKAIVDCTGPLPSIDAIKEAERFMRPRGKRG